MAKTIQRLQGTERLNFFGVRHLSPASAYFMLDFLNKLKPEKVLLEGPANANEFLPLIAGSGVKPPFALLSYTAAHPVRSIMYPLAEYSPEYQAIRWAFENNARMEFIDLPTEAALEYYAEKHDDEPGNEIMQEFYDRAAELAGENDYETFWERNFEHCSQTNEFIEKISALSESMRACENKLNANEKNGWAAHNFTRESYMRMNIEKALAECEGKIAVVTGAYHVPGLRGEVRPMTDEEANALMKIEARLTLMPYSYYRLSSRSGYGAGNKAPAYFQMMWECLKKDGSLENLAAVYLSRLCAFTRKSGLYNSTASVIEAVRLAKGLALMRGSAEPALRELRGAAISLLGGGEFAAIAEDCARADVGAEMGELPEGLAQTPVQDNVNMEIKRLKLTRYKSVAAQDITLDLREKRTVKSEESAFLDLSRSIFFNRLKLLNIGFAKEYEYHAASAWSEKWALRWTPEVEIEIVETALKGESIEIAAALTLKEKFEESQNILETARLIKQSYACHLLEETEKGLRRLQSLCSDGGSFADIAMTCREVADIIKYKDVRAVDTSPLAEIMRQLFLKGSLLLFDGAAATGEAADRVIEGIDKMHAVSREHGTEVDDELWILKLRDVAESDSRGAKISGVAAALLMERGKISDEDLKLEVSRRLSAGTPGDLAALWFEGLSARNKYVLLSRISIWKQLDDYLSGLEEEEFRRSLVFLRRAFCDFDPREKNSVTEILADFWGIDPARGGEFLRDGEFSTDEMNELDSFNDFDFGDL